MKQMISGSFRFSAIACTVLSMALLAAPAMGFNKKRSRVDQAAVHRSAAMTVINMIKGKDKVNTNLVQLKAGIRVNHFSNPQSRTNAVDDVLDLMEKNKIIQFTEDEMYVGPGKNFDKAEMLIDSQYPHQ